jgi:hypothetical protein
MPNWSSMRTALWPDEVVDARRTLINPASAGR